MVGTRRTPSVEPVSRPTRKPPSPGRPRRRRASATPPPPAATTTTTASRRTRINRNQGPVAVEHIREEPAPQARRKRARSPTSSAQNRSAPQARDTDNDGRPINGKRVRRGSNTERTSGAPSTSWLTPVREEIESSSRHSSQALDAETITGTQVEAEDLDPETMLEELEFLEKRTESLLELLVLNSKDFTSLQQAVQQPDSEESRSLRRNERGFSFSKSVFGKGDVLLPQAVNDALETTEHHEKILRANTAILAMFLATSHPLDGGNTAWEDFRSMERNFPRYLGVSVTEKNFEIMLDFRTEALLSGISANRHTDKFTVEQFIVYFFYEHTNSQDGQSLDSAHLRSWPDLKYPGWIGKTKQRVKELRRAFSKDQDEGFLDMCAKYPWESISKKLILYLRGLIQPHDQSSNSPRRDSALRSPLLPAPASSSRNIAAASQASLALQTATGSDGAPELPQAPPRNAAAQKTFKDKNAFASLKKNNRKSQTSNPDAAPLSPPPEAANLVSEPPEGYAPSGPEPPVAEVMDMLERSRRQSNKENVPQKRRFVDPQVGAERLSFDSQEVPTSAQGQEAQRTSNASQQRGESSRAGASRPAELQASPEQTAETRRQPPRPTIQSVTDDEDEYAADNREADQDRVQQSRAQAGASRPSNSTNRTRPSDSTNRTRPSNASSRARPSDEHFEYRQNSPRSDDENERPPPSTAAEVLREKIKDQGRRQRIGHRYDREEYTPAEEDALIEDIGTYGNHWALIKQRGNPLNRERTNVQLKDKAISLKVQYLKSHTPLPAGFWKFHVRKRDHDQLLQDYGVDTYEVDQEQMEAEREPVEQEQLQEDYE